MSEETTMPQPVKVGIENLQAAIKATSDLADTMGVVFSDGKLSLADLPHLPALIRSINALVKAAQKAAPEAKDIDANEAQELVTALIPLIANIASKFGYKVA
jgi:hypothetical protein